MDYEADNQIPIENKINAEERVMCFFPKEYSDIKKSCMRHRKKMRLKVINCSFGLFF